MVTPGHQFEFRTNICVFVCVCVVAESLALRGRYLVDLDSEVNVQVGPIYKHQLCKFQVRSRTGTHSMQHIMVCFPLPC